MPASTRIRTTSTTLTRPYDRPSPNPSPAKFLSYPTPPPAPESPEPNKDHPPDHPGLPTYLDYKRIEAGYLHSLSPRKRDKALITQAMFDKIWDVLHQPDACTIETPQFRFWVRKMFMLSRPPPPTQASDPHTTSADGEHEPGDDEDEDEDDLERAMGIAPTDADASLLATPVVLHENRPVAIQEQLYELFCYCHVRAGHGGRDKTCAVIRQHYSWVPKELTAQFVKACPTCTVKRSGGREVEGQRRKKETASRVSARERGSASLSAGPSSPGCQWPMTGGPLDPANALPFGVCDREHIRTPSNPLGTSRIDSAPRQLEAPLTDGWNTGTMPRALTARADPASPYRLYDPVYEYNSEAFLADTTRTSSPSRPGDLPSLATALSDESLDGNLNLTGLGKVDGKCLPPALRPLRLSGPVSSTTTGPTATEYEDTDLVEYPIQIDPVLLSFNYRGINHAGTLVHSKSEVDGALQTSSPIGSRDVGMTLGLYDGRRRPRTRGIGLPALDPSDSTTASSESPDSPDSCFERGFKLPGYTLGASPRRYFGYAYEGDAPGLATMLLPSLNEVDGPGALSRFSFLTDA